MFLLPPPSTSSSSSSSPPIFLFLSSTRFSPAMVSSLRDATPLSSESFYNILSHSISNSNCGTSEGANELDSCRDDTAAFQLKLVAIVSILLAGIFGIAIPLIGKNRRFLCTDSNPFFAAKAFAAGVILATGFVHMLPDSTTALTDKCLPEFPWLEFPVSGFIAMMSALATLLAEFVGTQYYRERKQDLLAERNPLLEEGGVTVSGKVFGEEEGGGMHIVGMHAHAAHHRHSHAHGEDACGGSAASHSLHSHEVGEDDEDGGARHLVVSQILEMGIVSHSVIIGLSLGVSQSPCTIRPLIAALTFHQFFEGFALGGCISQAQYSNFSATMMASFFAMTTPAGVVLGMAVSSFYNRNSPRALIVEGTLDGISAGILVYMALVDLIAADFLSKRMSCNVRLQVVSYFALFAGAVMMSSLAIWV